MYDVNGTLIIGEHRHGVVLAVGAMDPDELEDANFHSNRRRAVDAEDVVGDSELTGELRTPTIAGEFPTRQKRVEVPEEEQERLDKESHKTAAKLERGIDKMHKQDEKEEKALAAGKSPSRPATQPASKPASHGGSATSRPGGSHRPTTGSGSGKATSSRK